MNPAIVTIGIGGWYPRGVARLIESLKAVDCTVPVYSWINTVPPGAPKNRRTYLAYRAKPFAMQHVAEQGHDIILWLDAAFYAVAPIHPLLNHIHRYSYYLCDNGAFVGEWCSDEALPLLGITREESMTIPEVASGIVGLNMRYLSSRQFLKNWCRDAIGTDRGTPFAGFHGNTAHPDFKEGSRNPGWCSDDPRVKGHRHDQTSASVIAHRLGMNRLISKPVFWDYEEGDDRTVLVNRGGL